MDDQFHRDVHPLIRRYVLSLIHTGDQSFIPILRFRGGSGNDHCAICDQGTGLGPLIICDQCECKYHADCLGDLSPGDEQGFICPKCTDTVEEITNPAPAGTSTSPPSKGETCYPLSDAGSSNTARMSPLRPPPDRFDYLSTPWGYVVVQKDPIEFVNYWHGSLISTSEGVSQSGDHMHPFQIDGVRWHFLKTLADSRLGIELLPFVHSEAQLQRAIDAADNVYTIGWKVLRVAQSFYGATLFLGGTAVTAPPFFGIAGRTNVLYWPTRQTCEIGDDPLVVSLADITDNEFDEVYAPHLRQRHDWVILTPSVPKGSKKKSFLDSHGCQISTGQGKIFRERGWWLSGQDKLASYSTEMEGWVAAGQTLDAKLLSTLTGALQCTAPHDPPFLEDSVPARLYWNGTKMGLLGLHSSVHDIYATDGSLEGGRMGAGVYIVKSGMALRCRVGRSSESRTSLRIETGPAT
jgi:hypothetical protein